MINKFEHLLVLVALQTEYTAFQVYLFLEKQSYLITLNRVFDIFIELEELNLISSSMYRNTLTTKLPDHRTDEYGLTETGQLYYNNEVKKLIVLTRNAKKWIS